MSLTTILNKNVDKEGDGRLGEHVGELQVRTDRKNLDDANNNLFPNKMAINLDVLGAFVEYWVVGNVDSGLMSQKMVAGEER